MAEWVRFQKWVANQLNKIGFKARANGQAGGGFGVPDVYCGILHCECKSYTSQRPDIQKALLQAKMDCSGHSEKYPVAITRYSNGKTVEKPLVSMYFSDFINLLKEIEDGGKVSV